MTDNINLKGGGNEEVTSLSNELNDSFTTNNQIGGTGDIDILYRETSKYLDNYNGIEYQQYLKEFESFFKEQNTNSNLSKYNYISSNNKLIKKSKNNSKELINISLPDYKNVKDILKQINYKIDDTKFHLKKIRTQLLHNSSNRENIKKFQDLQADYIKLTHIEQIFTTYHYKINNKDVINERLNNLIEERNNKKLKLHSIMLKIREVNNTTKNYLEIKKLAEEYLKINNINEIDKTISELIHIPSIDHVVMSLPVYDKSELLEPLEQKQTEKIKIKKKKLKIKETSVKPTEDPKKTNIETSVIDISGKKRRQIKGKKVEEATCVFPFKEKNKYVTEDDGCINSKSGEWCATSVNKNDDYSYDKIGFCKK